jgi:hypothetical protein
MATTVLTVSKIVMGGVASNPTAATATDGDAFPNTGREYLEVANGSGAPIIVTLDVQRTTDSDGATVTDPTVTVAAGATKRIGPFNPATYNDANGRVKATCSAVATVTVEAVQLPSL